MKVKFKVDCDGAGGESYRKGKEYEMNEKHGARFVGLGLAVEVKERPAKKRKGGEG